MSSGSMSGQPHAGFPPRHVQLIQRVRRMGITSHIRVDLGTPPSWILGPAGLRNDLNAIDGAAASSTPAGPCRAPHGVSLEPTPTWNAVAALPSLDLLGGLHGVDRHLRDPPADVFSDAELLAASDSAFGLLDKPGGTPAPLQLLGDPTPIGLEISRGEVGREPEPA